MRRSLCRTVSNVGSSKGDPITTAGIVSGLSLASGLSLDVPVAMPPGNTGGNPVMRSGGLGGIITVMGVGNRLLRLMTAAGTVSLCMIR